MSFARLIVVCTIGLLAMPMPAVAVEGTGPGGGSCAEQCTAHAATVFQQCRAQGGGQDACYAQALADRNQCLQQNCQAPPPSPCQSSCMTVSELIGAACLEVLHDATKCATLRQGALESCSRDLCSTTTQACDGQCTTFAQDVFALCVRAGGTAEQCTGASAAVEARCDAAFCGETSEPTCEDRCAARGRLAHDHCVAEGNPEPQCATLGTTITQACVNDQCTAPTPDCREQCTAAAMQQFQSCVANGGTADTCRPAAEQQAQACVAACPADGGNDGSDGGGGDCTARCQAAADQLVQECLAAGVPEDECRARGDAANRHCVADHCDGVEPPDPTCAEQCESHAREVLQVCVAGGGSEDDCKAQARDGFTACVTIHCEVPASCDSRCTAKATAAKNRCLKRGGSETDCAQRETDVHDACLARCVPPPPDTCESDCESQAQAAEDQCVQDGGDAATCAQSASTALNDCQDQCGTASDPTCAGSCEQQAHQRFARALSVTHSRGRAKSVAKRAFRRCVAQCGNG